MSEIKKRNYRTFVINADVLQMLYNEKERTGASLQFIVNKIISDYFMKRKDK